MFLTDFDPYEGSGPLHFASVEWGDPLILPLLNGGTPLNPLGPPGGTLNLASQADLVLEFPLGIPKPRGTPRGRTRFWHKIRHLSLISEKSGFWRGGTPLSRGGRGYYYPREGKKHDFFHVFLMILYPQNTI
jgi:hypothetical protein